MHCKEIALFNAISFRRYPFLLLYIIMKSAPGVLIMFLVVESAYPKIVDSLLFSPDLQWRWRARCSFVKHLRPRLNGTPEHGNLGCGEDAWKEHWRAPTQNGNP
jgi:hypothetical protein